MVLSVRSANSINLLQDTTSIQVVNCVKTSTNVL